jgi:hypothetical protein
MTDLILNYGVTRFENTSLFCRLGFGSFVDKVVMPYVSTVPRKLEEPCEGCAAPYGFKHHMRLRYHTHANLPVTSVVDPHGVNVDPDPAVFLLPDPDPVLNPGF